MNNEGPREASVAPVSSSSPSKITSSSAKEVRASLAHCAWAGFKQQREYPLQVVSPRTCNAHNLLRFGPRMVRCTRHPYFVRESASWSTVSNMNPKELFSIHIAVAVDTCEEHNPSQRCLGRLVPSWIFCSANLRTSCNGSTEMRAGKCASVFSGGSSLRASVPPPLAHRRRTHQKVLFLAPTCKTFATKSGDRLVDLVFSRCKKRRWQKT